MKYWELQVLIQEVSEKITNLDPELEQQVKEDQLSDIENKFGRIKQLMLSKIL